MHAHDDNQSRQLGLEQCSQAPDSPASQQMCSLPVLSRALLSAARGLLIHTRQNKGDFY